MHEFSLFIHNLRVLVHFARGIIGGLVFGLLTIALLLAWVEDLSLGNAIYFTLITGLTVGYGDITPTTALGKAASVIAALIGMIATGIYVAIATKAVAASVEGRRLERIRPREPFPRR